MDLINYTDRKTFYEYRNTIKIVYSEYKDAEYLKDHLRPTDIRECQIHGITPYRALNIPFKEDQGVNHPVSLYAATKRSNELMAHSYSSIFNLRTTGLRFFTVYGPWGRPDMALYIFT